MKDILDESLKVTDAFRNGKITACFPSNCEVMPIKEGFTGRLWQVPYIALKPEAGSVCENLMEETAVFTLRISDTATAECRIDYRMNTGKGKLFFCKILGYRTEDVK